MPKRPYHYHHGTKQYFFQNSFLFKLNFEYTKSGVPEDLDWCWTNVEKIKEESSITLIYLSISMFPGAGVSVLTKQLQKGNIGERWGGGGSALQRNSFGFEVQGFCMFFIFFGGGDIYHLLGRGVPTTFSTHCSSNAEAEASQIRLRGIQ